MSETTQFNDLRNAVVREVHRDDAVVITGGEYLSGRLLIQTAREHVRRLIGARMANDDHDVDLYIGDLETLFDLKQQEGS